MKLLPLGKWRHFWLASFLLVLSAYVVWACAGGDWEDGYESNYTPETFVTDASYHPFFYSNLFYYSINYDTQHNTRFNQNNADEWQQYLGSAVKKNDVAYFLNTASRKGVDSVYLFLQGKITQVPPAARRYPSLTANNNDKVKSFFRYLSYAKNSEDFAVQDVSNYWDYEETKNNRPKAATFANLLSGLNAAFADTKDAFVKQRYWFQLVRFYFNFDAPKAIQLFEQNQANFSKNTLYYRTMAYAAGAYYKQKNYAQANYYYSLVFDAGNNLKTVAHFSFHPQDEKDWQKTLSLCKNDNEKTTLWQMLGIFYADEARSINEIYKINPQSNKLDVLLTRLVNKAEIDGSRYYQDGEEKTNMQQERTQNLVAQIKTIQPIADAGKVANPFLWNVSVGYLQFLAQNYTQANAYYAKADKQLPNTELAKKQLRLLKLLTNVGALNKINEKNETDLLPDLQWLYAQNKDNRVDKFRYHEANPWGDYNEETENTTRNAFRYREAQQWVLNTLANKYAAQNNAVKAECLVTNTAFYANNQNIEQLKTFLSKPNPTPYEQFCITICTKKMDDLWEFQAIQDIYNDKIDEAVIKMQKAGSRAKVELLANPFSNKIPDCHDCDHALPQKSKYTKLSFLQKIQEMKQKLDANNDPFNNALLIGSGLYNISHYGNGRVFYEGEVIGSGHYSPYAIDKTFMDMLTNNALSVKYYQIALKNATDNEQKAKCQYFMAKCQRNEWYNQTMYNNPDNEYSYDENKPDFIEWQGFKELKKYADTKYFQQVLKECGYFASINGKK